MPELIAPSVRVHTSFLAAMAEFQAEGRGGPGDHSSVGREIREYGPRWADPAVFADFAASLRAEADVSIPVPEGWVHSTTLWYVGGDEYLGRVALRHHLTPQLTEVGGHVGYDVRPSARRRGYATEMTRQVLAIAAGLGIERALITCDADNVASRRVIEANGGVWEDQRGETLRFWAPTAKIQSV
ncbi:GNAT family N-acetyltransferase [Fodinicola feengrottensis]|uniref:GNAT family N-acetyltransferase n=1 Tax=Fodinicola feengrottensis TaxID=435914 RepID=A0ABN2FXK3_9ACTN|nr:GNAT family N-acetyltransferase [Fodinicola feengrottensis]